MRCLVVLMLDKIELKMHFQIWISFLHPASDKNLKTLKFVCSKKFHKLN